MKKNILFVLLLSLLIAAALTASVSADQNGNDRWCFIDNNGCWITGDNGEQWYIMFWSEPTRKFFMGDSTPPYKDVVKFPENLKNRMSLDEAPADPEPVSRCSSYSWGVSSSPSPNAVKLIPIILD